VSEGALPGGLDPRVGAVAEGDQEGDEVGGRNQALAALAARVLRELATFFGRARRSALFS